MEQSLEDIWNLKLISKYPLVYITGPKLTCDPYELIARLDSSLNCYGLDGNDTDLAMLIHSWQKQPTQPKVFPIENRLINAYASTSDLQKIFNKSEEDIVELKNQLKVLGDEAWFAYDNERDYFNCYWGQFVDGFNIFHVDLLSSPHGSPTSWFNPYTLKVGGYNSFGKWPETVDTIRKSVEWFAEEFPEVDITLSIVDEEACIAQLHVHEGKIIPEEPNIPLKTLKKICKDNLSKYSAHKWLFNPLYIFYRRHLMSKKARYEERRNVWTCSRHYREQFFSWEDIQNIIYWWDDQNRDYWKDHSFNEYFEVYKQKYLGADNE